MKNYFGFTLEGKNIFLYWILYMILFIAPYGWFLSQSLNNPGVLLPPADYIVLFAAILFVYVLYYFFAKLTIENITFEGKKAEFHGSFGTYLGIFLGGLLLTLITLGIYGAWFVRNLMSFFVDNTSYNGEKLKFKGKGSRLFVIMLLCIMIPVIVLSVIMGIFIFKNPGEMATMQIIINSVVLLIMIPFYYLLFKWMIDIDYSNFKVSLEARFWPSCGKIALEIFLAVITCGIYAPLAGLKIYKYFIDKTVALSDNEKKRTGYDIENLSDFLFIWGQILLTLITATIYFPWAYSKIGKRIAGKSYISEY